MILPGWSCGACGAFNGEAKERRSTCRVCDGARRAPIEEDAVGICELLADEDSIRGMAAEAIVRRWRAS